jgi:hypothetical protein
MSIIFIVTFILLFLLLAPIFGVLTDADMSSPSALFSDLIHNPLKFVLFIFGVLILTIIVAGLLNRAYRKISGE